MKKTISAAVCAVAIVAGAVVWLRAAPIPRRSGPSVATTATPTIGTLNAIPSVVAFNVPAPVTFTVQITDPTLLPGGVNLLRVDSTGKTLATVGLMYDDGTHGDSAGNDKTFTTTVALNETATGTAYFEASAAFKGQLKRSVSNLTPLAVWSKMITPNGISLIVPPQWAQAPSSPSDPNVTTILPTGTEDLSSGITVRFLAPEDRLAFVGNRNTQLTLTSERTEPHAGISWTIWRQVDQDSTVYDTAFATVNNRFVVVSFLEGAVSPAVSATFLDALAQS